MKAVSDLDNKEQETVFLLVSRTQTLVLSALFLNARSGAQVNLYAQKFSCLERNLSTRERLPNSEGGSTFIVDSPQIDKDGFFHQNLLTSHTDTKYYIIKISVHKSFKNRWFCWWVLQ